MVPGGGVWEGVRGGWRLSGNLGILMDNILFKL